MVFVVLHIILCTWYLIRSPFAVAGVSPKYQSKHKVTDPKKEEVSLINVLGTIGHYDLKWIGHRPNLIRVCIVLSKKVAPARTTSTDSSDTAVGHPLLVNPDCEPTDASCIFNAYLQRRSPHSSESSSPQDRHYHIHRLPPGIFDLPPPKQSARRVLVSYCIGSMQPPDEVFMRRQLDHYVDACERGYEVHVIISTFRDIMTNTAIHRLVGGVHTAAYYCLRTAQVLPVVFDFVNSSEVPGNSLPALHRYQFHRFNGTYDYYIVQEGDCAVRAMQLDYFVKWSAFLQGTPFIPGFKFYEVQYQDVKSTTQMHEYMPAHSWFCNYMQFLKVRGETFFTQDRVFQLFIIYSQSMLTDAISLKSWYHDLNLPISEHNVHLSRQYLARHYITVYPTSDLYSFQTHHASDKYVHLNENVTGAYRYYRVEELNAIVDFALHGNAKNISSPHMKFHITLKNQFLRNSDQISIASCIASGKRFALVNLQFMGTCRASQSNGCFVSLDINRCEPIQAIRFNQLTKCTVWVQSSSNASSSNAVLQVLPQNACHPQSYITLNKQTSFAYLNHL